MTEDLYKSEKAMITDAVREYYDRVNDVDVEVTVEHRGMNWFDATATFTDKRLGTVKAHYTVLMINGRVVFQ